MPVGVDWEAVLHLTRSVCCACDGCTMCKHECRLPAAQAQARHEHTRAVGNHLMGDPLNESRAKFCLRCDNYFDPRGAHRCPCAGPSNLRRDRLRRRIANPHTVESYSITYKRAI
jgi:hypothetical protein